MRGENYGHTEQVFTIKGTSPRARGKLGDAIGWAWNNRNIPACAGKTATLQIGTPYGEGTSPRARGKPESRPRRDPEGRNIPACAGKTASE